MKKQYVTPNLEIILLETNDIVMAGGGDFSEPDPFDPQGGSFSIQQYLNDLPNGTILDEDGYEKR